MGLLVQGKIRLEAPYTLDEAEKNFNYVKKLQETWGGTIVEQENVDLDGQNKYYWYSSKYKRTEIFNDLKGNLNLNDQIHDPQYDSISPR